MAFVIAALFGLAGVCGIAVLLWDSWHHPQPWRNQ